MSLHWNSTAFYANPAKTLAAKFKQVKAGLKKWSRELSKLGKLINNCNWVLALLDGLVDQRRLNTVERNFRKIVISHLLKLLEAKRIYWKQRNTARWVKFADENTGLFQAMASYSHRRNFISQLQLQDGVCISDHAQMAGALWSSYKERLGISDFVGISFDLVNLIQSIALSWIILFPWKKLKQ